jgi:integrase
MGKMAKGLTDIAIRNLKPGPTRREVPDRAARGLYLVIQPSGVKTFAVRYRFGGQNRKLTLQPGISLAAARKAAADALFQVTQGGDPCAAKRQAEQARRAVADDTFRVVAEEYFKREGDRLRTARGRRAALERLVFPALGHRPIADIRRSELIRLLDRIEEGVPLGIKGGPVMADRTLAAVRRIMNWHATRSDDFRSPIVRGMARASGRKRARDRILTDNELRAVWQAAEASEKPFARLIQFLLLTSCRRGEAGAMMWQEIDGTDWTLPAARNKTKVDLTRPLSAAAQDVLARVPRVVGCEHVFTNDGRHAMGGLSRLKRAFDEECGVQGWVLHDLRRTARSLMSRTGVNADHAERCLGHVIGGVRGVYDRHQFRDEMRHAFEVLAVQIVRIVDPVQNVIALPARG